MSPGREPGSRGGRRREKHLPGRCLGRGMDVAGRRPTGAEGETVGPGYPALTYNNVLLDRGPEGSTVFLPRYGLKVLDQMAEEAWSDLGYRVVAVAGLTVSAMYGGSLRCCVKVLSRSAGDAAPGLRAR